MAKKRNTKQRYTFTNKGLYISVTSTVKQLSDERNLDIKELYQLTDGLIPITSNGWTLS